MKRIALTVALLLGIALTKQVFEEKHIINQEKVDRIKASGVKWKPFEVHENPFKDVPMEKLRKMYTGLNGVSQHSFIQEQLMKVGFLSHLLP
jgi:hypothetical protein